MSKELEPKSSNHFKRNSEYHRWTGAFLDPELESDYIAHHNNTWVRSVYPTISLLTLCAACLFGLVDWLSTPEIIEIALATRFGIIVPLLLFFWLIRNHPSSNKIYRFLPTNIIVIGSIHLFFLGIIANEPIGKLLRIFPVIFVTLTPLVLGLLPKSTLFNGLAVLAIFIGVEIIWMPDDTHTLILISVTLFVAIFVTSFGTSLIHKARRNSYWQNIVIERQMKQIDIEHAKSDSLLHNILPVHVAKELKVTGKSEPKRFENVTILFTDFKGFTGLVASIPADKLVTELNDIFSRFDSIMTEFGVEKIQTIGDAYLAACGLPEIVDDHAQKCVLVAKKMIEYLEIRNAQNEIQWQMRVGIHSGPIVAGVVGKSKFTYGLFGDTINTASRFETASEPGKINISSSTYEAIKDTFPCEYRGRIQAKGKGELDMYFVK